MSALEDFLAQGGESESDIKKLLTQIDTQTNSIGEQLPAWADGSSPLRPINKSPVSVEDRFRLGLGDDAGRLKFLKEKYQDVKRDKKGNFLVQQNDLWHRVDPDGLGDGNAHDISMEILSEIAENAKEITIAGASIATAGVGAGLAAGAGALGTAAAIGATSGLGAGAASITGSVMGKLAGTYDGTPEDMAKEAALEFGLNLAGTVIPVGLLAGGKATKDAVANRLMPYISKTLGTYAKGPSWLKDVAGTFVKAGGGISDEAWEYTMDNYAKVTARQKSLLKSMNPRQAKLAAQTQINDIGKQMLDQLPEAVDRGYTSILDEAMASVPPTTNFKYRETFSTFDSILDGNQGFFKELIDPKTGLLKAKDEIRTLAAGTAEMAGNPLAALIDSGPERRMLTKVIESINSLKNVAGDIPGNKIKLLHAKDKQVRSVLRRATEKAYRSPEVSNDFKKLLSNMQSSWDEALGATMEGALGANPVAFQKFKQARAQWAEYKNFFGKFLDASKRPASTERDRAAADLAQAVTGSMKGNKGREGLNLIRILGPTNPQLVSQQATISELNAAMEFLPYFRESFIQFGSVGAISSGLLTGSLSGATAGLAIPAAVTSPRSVLALGKLFQNPTTAKAFTKNARQASRLLKSGGEKASSTIRSNEKLLLALYQGILNTAVTAEDMKNQMVQQGLGAR